MCEAGGAARLRPIDVPICLPSLRTLHSSGTAPAATALLRMLWLSAAVACSIRPLEWLCMHDTPEAVGALEPL